MTKLGIQNQSINLKQQFFTLLALKRPQTWHQWYQVSAQL